MKRNTAQTPAQARAVGYRRCSTQERRRNGRGLADQGDSIMALVERNGYSFGNMFTDDGISGTAPLAKRPGLNAAIAACMAGEADILVVYALDRLSRDVGLAYTLREQLRKLGVKLETVNEGVLTADENLFKGDLYAAFAAEERRRITARLLDGRRQRGKVDGLGAGLLPYGYVRVESIGVDEQAASVVCKVLAFRDEGLSFQKAADAMNQAGIASPSGGKWYTSGVFAIESRRELYQTGRKTWSNEEASVLWPVIYLPSDKQPEDGESQLATQ